MSRPADVLRWTYKHNYDPQQQAIVYTPWKLRNKKNPPTTIVPLSKEALKIINKYKGQNKNGYIMPLPMNETDWYKLDEKGYKKWERCRKNTIFAINSYLNKIAKAMKLEIPNLTMYVFRHSAITHAIKVHNINASIVARWAGTSTKMIDKHYLGNLNTNIVNPL